MSDTAPKTILKKHLKTTPIVSPKNMPNTLKSVIPSAKTTPERFIEITPKNDSTNNWLDRFCYIVDVVLEVVGIIILVVFGKVVGVILGVVLRILSGVVFALSIMVVDVFGVSLGVVLGIVFKCFFRIVFGAVSDIVFLIMFGVVLAFWVTQPKGLHRVESETIC